MTKDTNSFAERAQKKGLTTKEAQIYNGCNIRWAGIRMSCQLKKGNMQYLWQSVCRNVEDYDESSRHVTVREVLEETGLEVILGDLQYLLN